MMPTFENDAAIYDKYCAPYRFIEFGGNVYKFRGTERKGTLSIHNYRCNYEQHNLQICLRNDIPFHIRGTYKIEVNENAVQRTV